MQSSIPAVLMRGGTSRGLYFKKADLPDNRDLWDDILLKAFGSPDPRQVDALAVRRLLPASLVFSRRRNATIAILTIFSPSLPLTKPKSITRRPAAICWQASDPMPLRRG